VADHAVVVVGAGAAGLMAARFAALEGARVLLLERTADGGRKILISGGGRCNVLPGRFEPRRFVTDSSPNLLGRLLRAWPLDEQRRYFEEVLGLPLRLEEESGKLFPVSNRARDVRDRLVDAARGAGVEIAYETSVTALEPPGAPGGPWRVGVTGASPLYASRVVLATGGLSVPATGSDGTGLALVRRLGHRVHATYPALTPLTADPAVHAELAGVSLTVTLDAPGARPRFRTTGGFLFTHRGYSGPAVLDASHLAVRSRLAGGARQALTVAWTALDRDAWEARFVETGSGTVGGLLARELPTRLAERLADEAGVPRDRSLARLRREERRALLGALTSYELPWTGDEGYRKAEVTGGGVALDQVDPATLESRVTPGLHLCGEILDAFGPIGGHNFLWAWATGRTAGLSAGALASTGAPVHSEPPDS
jgi:predicted Rossmann fold flavoprotein